MDLVHLVRYTWLCATPENPFSSVELLQSSVNETESHESFTRITHYCATAERIIMRSTEVYAGLRLKDVRKL